MIPQEQIESFFDTVQAIRAEIAKEIIGQERVVEQLLTALIAGGNVLLEGVRAWARRAWCARSPACSTCRSAASSSRPT